MSKVVLSTAIVLMAVGTACQQKVPLTDAPCPCIDGFQCCSVLNLCVQEQASCPSFDAGADETAEPDAAIGPSVCENVQWSCAESTNTSFSLCGRIWDVDQQRRLWEAGAVDEDCPADSEEEGPCSLKLKLYRFDEQGSQSDIEFDFFVIHPCGYYRASNVREAPTGIVGIEVPPSVSWEGVVVAVDLDEQKDQPMDLLMIRKALAAKWDEGIAPETLGGFTLLRSRVDGELTDDAVIVASSAESSVPSYYFEGPGLSVINRQLSRTDINGSALLPPRQLGLEVRVQRGENTLIGQRRLLPRTSFDPLLIFQMTANTPASE